MRVCVNNKRPLTVHLVEIAARTLRVAGSRCVVSLRAVICTSKTHTPLSAACEHDRPRPPFGVLPSATARVLNETGLGALLRPRSGRRGLRARARARVCACVFFLLLFRSPDEVNSWQACRQNEPSARPSSMCARRIWKGQLLTVDLLARGSMKNAAKCDT